MLRNFTRHKQIERLHRKQHHQRRQQAAEQNPQRPVRLAERFAGFRIADEPPGDQHGVSRKTGQHVSGQLAARHREKEQPDTAHAGRIAQQRIPESLSRPAAIAEPDRRNEKQPGQQPADHDRQEKPERLTAVVIRAAARKETLKVFDSQKLRPEIRVGPVHHD